jgi:hypothetical protein
MDTLTPEEPASTETPVTPSTEQPEETVSDDTSTDGKQEDAATLKKRLADKDRYIKELESRKPKEEKPDNRSAEIKELEWKLENKERIKLVEEEYSRILEEGWSGEKVSNRIALELAEKQAKIDTSGTKRSRQSDMSTPSVTARASNPKGYEDEIDRELGLTIEKKRKLEEKHPHLRS